MKNQKNKQETFHTLIINYACLSLGGIEVNLAKLMERSVKKNCRVILFTTEKELARAKLINIVNNERIEKVLIGQGKKLFQHIQVSFSDQESITMLSFEPIAYLAAEELRGRYSQLDFSHFLVLPHFTGNAYFPDRYFVNTPLHSYFFHFIKKVVNQLNSNDAILAFSLKHLLAYEEAYGITVENKDQKLIPIFSDLAPSDTDLIRTKAVRRSEQFRIVTCSRFDFPHKGYLLGLISAFAELKNEYPQLELVIVGDGSGRAEIEETIGKLEKHQKDAITLTGFLTPDQLNKQFQAAHLNIGVAGAVSDGALNSVVSLPARHYSYSCETYGFYEDALGKTLSVEPGDPIKPYIRRVIEMDDEDYIRHSVDAKQAAEQFISDGRMTLDELLSLKNDWKAIGITKGERINARIVNIYLLLARKLFGISPYSG